MKNAMNFEEILWTMLVYEDEHIEKLFINRKGFQKEHYPMNDA